MVFVLSRISGQRLGHILTGAVSLLLKEQKNVLTTVLAVW